MADERAKADKAAERAAERGTQSNPENVPEEVRYSAEELRENAHGLLGVSAHAVAGALADESRKTFTLGEAEKLVNAFLNRPVEGAES